MIRGMNPLLRPSSRHLTTLLAAAGRPVLVPRLANPQALQRVTRAARPGLLSVTWKTGYATKPPVQPTQIDRDQEREISKRKIQPHPELVSTKSTVRQVIEPVEGTAKSAKDDEQDVMRDVKSDLNTVAETFSLATVPREAFALGMAGTLPYLGTSISTMYLSWVLNTEWPTSSNILNTFMVSNETASQWLHLLEPIQLGYGAVIISFLGAIHWGLEFAEKAPSKPRTTFRYGIGVLAPALAWPTLILPVEWALIGQFMAFTLLYFADSRAAARGWAPYWYGTYRFVLTFVVGLAIFIILVGRAKIGDKAAATAQSRRMDKTTRDAEPYSKWEKLEGEEMEKERIKKQKEEEEKKRKEEEAKKKEEEEKKKGAQKEKKGAEKEKEGAKKEKESAEKEKEEAKADKEGQEKEKEGAEDNKDEAKADGEGQDKEKEKKD